MTKQEIFKLVRDVLSRQLGENKDNITMETQIAEDLGADSLDAAEMLVEAECDMGISVPDDDVIAFRTVSDIVDYLWALSV